MTPASGAPLISAIRGPVMLILTGILFAADKFGGYPFSKTWPALVIGLGLLLLVERGVRS